MRDFINYMFGMGTNYVSRKLKLFLIIAQMAVCIIISFIIFACIYGKQFTNNIILERQAVCMAFLIWIIALVIHEIYVFRKK